MSRLIDSDALLESLISCNGLGRKSCELVVNVVKSQPTAFDVDKVVDQIEKDSYVKLYGSNNSNNYLIPVKRAVEIVKGGGVDA